MEGNFFSAQDQASSAAVCVLGEKAKVDLLGYGPAVGEFVKANDTWLQVVGVLGRQISSGSTVSGGQVQDKNNVIYTPLTSLQYLFWDNNWFKDDLDGIDMRL